MKKKYQEKTNWYDSTIFGILQNEVYKGDYVQNKKSANPTYYYDVCPALIKKEFKMLDNYLVLINIIIVSMMIKGI